ncbi:hypothetical protein HZA43_05565 [Candidatus Peregrinibacteria bacterium]|nr:hypothetical protein [Candidatus Peregrinibacteria bacterium]
MLNKEDKRFIIEAIIQSEGRMSARFDVKLDAKLDGLRTELKTEIRHQGVLLEGLSDVVYSIAEGVSTLNDRMGRVEKDVAEIKDNISDLPEIRTTVKRHSRELAELKR